jgi:trans-aconitate methyltransferase
MEVKTLAIDQTAVAKAEIGIIKGFISDLNNSKTTPINEVQLTLERLAQSDSLLLKSVDSALSFFLSTCMAPLKDDDHSKRALFVKDLESKFQSQRATTAGQELLDLILTPLLNQISPKEIWIPGCGEGYEAAWIESRFPGTNQTYLDIDVEALEKLRKRLTSTNHKAIVSQIDLTQANSLPNGQPDLVLFFNPFVIEHQDYQRLIVTLSDKKLTDGKAESFLKSLSMSAQSQSIFDNILARMAKIYFVSVTMDLAEAHVIYKYFESRKISVTCYRNPYAIKNLASHVLNKRNPRTEPKIYHYVIVADA